MRAALAGSFFAFFCLVPAVAIANEVDTDSLPPAPPPKDGTQYEKECPQGAFKFQGTCWVQGDCPEGEALYKEGICLPIPGWVSPQHGEAERAKTPDAPADKAEGNPKK